MISYLNTISRLKSYLRLYFTCSTEILKGVIRLLNKLHSIYSNLCALKRVPHCGLAWLILLLLHFYSNLNQYKIKEIFVLNLTLFNEIYVFEIINSFVGIKTITVNNGQTIFIFNSRIHDWSIDFQISISLKLIIFRSYFTSRICSFLECQQQLLDVLKIFQMVHKI